ncbi:MAG: class II fructose-bisphosphate aldolase family protein [Thermotogae bacterium]|nr:class II fructose-bisphosphate aldolase family protein [Thermotogota bacterium]
MPLLPSKELLNWAEKRNVAVAAFNFNNYEFLDAICRAAAEMELPVILATSEGAIKYMGVEVIRGMVESSIKRYGITASLHLDHGRSFETILFAIRHNYTSVMIDASDKPYHENVRLTRKVVEIAHPLGITVEAELGVLAGEEDEISAKESIYTDPYQAQRFVMETGVDMLAVAVGTSHGAYKFKGEPRIDLTRIRKIRELTGIPLVLHGASGIYEEYARKLGMEDAKGVPDAILKKAIEFGVRKVNTDTDLRMAFKVGVLETLREYGGIDPRKYLGRGREEVHKMAIRRLKVIST